jgi:hypothetical protein
MTMTEHDESTEVLLTLIDRLTTRVVDLERWQAQIATKVVTGEVEARSVTVKGAGVHGGRVHINAGDRWGSVLAMGEDTDKAPHVGLYAMTENVNPDGSDFAFLVARTADEDRVWLGCGGEKPDGASLLLSDEDGKMVASVPAVGGDRPA